MADRRAAIAFYGLLFSVTLWPTAGQSAVFSAGDLLVGGRPGYLFQGGPAYIENYGPSGVFQQHAALIDGGHPRDMIMVGSPERCIQVAKQYEKIGVDRLLCHLQFRGMSNDKIRESIRLFGEEVIPAFS